MFYKIENHSGQSLIELMMAMTIFILVISSIMFLVLDAQAANQQGRERTKATLIAQEGSEAAYSIASRGWRYLVNGNNYGIDDSSGNWDWQVTPNVIDNKYTRQVTVASVMRDNNGDIVDTGGNLDFDTKKVIAKTTWNFTPARPSEVAMDSYLTNWRSLKWTQTTQAEFDQGSKNQVVTTAVDNGEIRLATISTEAENNWTFTAPTDYFYNSADISVANDQASLVGTMSVIASGGTINPGFDTSLSPWTYLDWDQGVNEVNVTGSRITTGGNPGAYGRIRIPRGRNYKVGGFFRQSFSVTENNAQTANIKFDYKVVAFNGRPTVLRAYAFVDDFSGQPSIGTEVWASNAFTGATSWITVGPLDIASKVATAGTYYFKIAVWAEVGTTTAGLFDVGFDNASAVWEKTGLTYPTNNPDIRPASSFSQNDVSAWLGFEEMAIKNGGQIYYQLSDDDGSNWQYWNGSVWTRAAGPADYNTADIVNNNISVFSVNNKKIMFKAFLSSDGSQPVILDNVKVRYTTGAGANYYTSGTFESLAFETSSDATLYNYLAWIEEVPAGTDLQFQIRTADTEANLAGAAWLGLDGSSSSYYTEAGQMIYLAVNPSDRRWVQYKAYFSSTGADTPILKEVTIDYES